MNAKIKITEQRGFTLVELVIVIVLIGILSAVVAVKYLDFSKEARVAAVNGFYNQLISAANTAHLKCKLTPTCLLTGDKISTIDMGGTNIEMLNGFPDLQGIQQLINININSIHVYRTNIDITYSPFDPADSRAAVCRAVYGNPTAAKLIDAETPLIYTVITGC